MELQPEIIRAFIAMAPYARIAAAICDSCVEAKWLGPCNLRDVCSISGLPLSQQGSVEMVLRAGANVGIFRQVSALSWETTSSHKNIIEKISPMLRGVAIYSDEVHRDENSVRVVLTRPPQPCRLEAALESGGYSFYGLDNTSEAFGYMAAQATKRFMVMTPFLDEQGAEVVLSLFKKATNAKCRELILRSKEGGIPPEGYSSIQKHLKALGVAVYDYRLDREHGSGYETFHGKVILVDNDWCYVGSANMTKWSFNYSMEIGITVRGSAATRIGQISDAIIKIARKY